MPLNLQTKDPRNERERDTDTAILRAQFDASPALRAEFDDDFDRYAAYCKGMASGRVKVVRGVAR